MKSILPVVFSLLTVSIYSQPIIPISSSAKVGDQWKQAITNETTDPGPTGQNQFWDFSEVTVSEGG